MSPVYHDGIEQGTSEWHALRAGKFSASKGAVIMGKLDTSGLSDYLKTLAWERVYGPTADEGFKSAAMDRGHQVEPEARDWYAFERDVAIEEIGCVEHGRIPNLIWSPDGLFAGRRCGIEIKSPLHKAWMEVKRTGLVPSEYRWQTKFGLFIGDLAGEDFVAYHPQAGGIVIPCEITDSEKDQIEARISVLEPKVMAWVDLLNDKKDAA